MTWVSGFIARGLRVHPRGPSIHNMTWSLSPRPMDRKCWDSRRMISVSQPDDSFSVMVLEMGCIYLFQWEPLPYFVPIAQLQKSSLDISNAIDQPYFLEFQPFMARCSSTKRIWIESREQSRSPMKTTR